MGMASEIPAKATNSDIKTFVFACVLGTSVSYRLLSHIPASISAEESIIYHGLSLCSTLGFAITNVDYTKRERERETISHKIHEQ